MTQAVLLLGGRGTRLWPLTDTSPKGLLPVAGLPFVEFQLRLLEQAEIKRVVLAVGAEHEPAWRDFVEGRQQGPELEIVAEDDPLDTAGQVVAMAGGLEERFLVLNGDVLFDTDLAGLLETAPAADAVLVLTRVEDPSAFGVVVVGESGRVERFVEKPAPGTAPADTVSAGAYLLRREALEGFGPGPVSFEREVWPRLAQEGRLAAVVGEGPWTDIGTPSLYLEANASVLSGRSRLHRPDAGHASGEGAVGSGARLGAWSWLGSHAVVEEGAVIEEAVVLDGAHVHPGAVVRRAVIGWDSDVLPGSVVEGEALVGAGCEIGPDCEIAHGLRVAPGTRLGKRAVTFSPPS